MIFLASQLLFLLFGLFGLIVWAYSDMPLAMREIAINTRRNTDAGSSYSLMKVLSVCLKILAVLLWFARHRIHCRPERRGHAFEQPLPGW